MHRIWILLIIAGCSLGEALPLNAQVVPTHLSNEGIYIFLDELATQKIIELVSLKKPYSRMDIAELLAGAETERAQLSSRQQAELDFYKRDYHKELKGSEFGDPAPAVSWLWQKNHGHKRFDVFHYSDSLFQITVNPVLGSDFQGNTNGSFYHWWNGVEVWSYAGRFGIWASLRDNHESVELTARDFQNQRIGGGNIKIIGDGQRDYEEFRGGITYAWKWGSVGLIMDQFSWGENNAGSNIFSGRTPAFPRLELNMNPSPWFSFTYVHGVLVSEVVDSSQSFFVPNAVGPDFREVYTSKYLAANMFTFIPWRGFQLSAGNSVVYDKRYPHAGFLIPVAFYKAIDHTLNAGIDNMNSQLFLSASSRNLKNFHFYGTVFLDELAAGRIFNKAEFNFVSYKAGISSTMLTNARIVLEYTWTNALTFKHFVGTTTFESNSYNMGHYLEDNAKDLYIGFEYRPVRALNLKSYFNKSMKGPDQTFLGSQRNTIVPFDPIVWESVRFGVLATYQVANDLYFRTGYEWRDVSGDQEYLERWSPEVYHGQTGTWRFGLNFGF